MANKSGEKHTKIDDGNCESDFLLRKEAPAKRSKTN